MHLAIDTVRHHLQYTRWANRRLLNAAAGLSAEQLTRDFGTADRSVLGTLGHIFNAESLWLERLRGGVPLWPPAPTLAQLLAEWPGLGDNWLAWAETLTDTEREFAYQDLEGNPHCEALWQILLHVVNHSTHHRGQVAGFLRGLGVAPPPLDFIRFVRESK